MTPAGSQPGRVLVVWCPEWPVAAADAPVPRDGAWPPDSVGPQDGAAPGAGPGPGEFQRVVAVVDGFSPRLEVLRPGACAISARGPARYFGGEQALAAKIIEAVARCGYLCQAGIADGLFAARLAAQAAVPGEAVAVGAGRTRDFVASQPVSVLENPDLADLLPRLGIRTLGEFASLPATQAANRFGIPGTVAHRLARGLVPRPLAPRPPAADLSASAGFDPPERGTEPVVFAAKALAERMHAGLAARGLACVRMRVQVRCGDGQETTRLWRHDGLLSPLAVAERVRWQLAGWREGRPSGQDGWQAGDDGAEAGGITLLRLIPDQLVRDEGRQLALWGDAAVSDRVARAAVQVQAMLGHRAVMRPVLSGGRSPGEQVTLAPFGDAADPARPVDRPWPGRIPAPAPATVYPDPLPAMVLDGLGAGVTVTGRAAVSAPPARLSARDKPDLAVTAWAGPWPADERWWDPQAACRRARFQLVTEDGNAWLAAVQDGRWLIEARYD